ncbi:MAG: TIGR02147 family protein [Chitinispirillaceae bacterium]|nr:TIGR02147 family protein [Chitinispirillaceae bacterium]
MRVSPNIFEFIDFRKFLTAWRETEKENNPGITLEYLSAKLGQKNRVYFSDLEKGRRTIGPEVLDRLTRLMDLSRDEAKYFRAIVGYGQPSTYEEREFWFEQVVQLNNTPKKIVDKNTYDYYKKWYHTTIRAYLETCNFTSEYGTASKRLYNRVSPKEVEMTVKNLMALGLAAPDGDGYIKPTDKVLTTGDVVKNELLRQYQIANHDVLRTILEKDEPGTHDSTQLTVSVSKEGIERILKRIKQFRSEIISIAHKDEQKAERVYKIAIHAYPESRKD